MKKTYLILSLLFLTSVVFVSCVKKRGCTDPLSDNFDSEAVQDDDTCIPTRLKFVGEYDAHGTSHTGDEILTSYDQVGVTIADSTAFTANGLIIGTSNFDAQLYALSATVTAQYDLMVNRQSLGVYTYWGNGNINGRVLEINMTRIEEIILPDETIENDTLYLDLYGLKELEE